MPGLVHDGPLWTTRFRWPSISGCASLGPIRPEVPSPDEGAAAKTPLQPQIDPNQCKLILMVFAKRLRDGVRRGEITCSVRIWMRPHVKVGNRYRMDEGEIQVDSIKPIGLPDITGALARESGFLGVVDLLKVAKHGKGERIYLIRFHYVRPRRERAGQPKSA